MTEQLEHAQNGAWHPVLFSCCYLHLVDIIIIILTIIIITVIFSNNTLVSRSNWYSPVEMLFLWNKPLAHVCAS